MNSFTRTISLAAALILLLLFFNTRGNGIDEVFADSCDSLPNVKAKWPAPLYNKLFSNTEKKFLYKGINRYITGVSFDRKKMNSIDSLLLRRIHQYKQLGADFTWGFKRDMEVSFLYSIDEPMNGFYPVSILELEKFGMLRVTTYLFNSKGKITSSFIAATRGEIAQKVLKQDDPGTAANEELLGERECCIMYSDRVNDSTLVQVKAISKQDSLVPLKKGTLIIHSNGTITEPVFN